MADAPINAAPTSMLTNSRNAKFALALALPARTLTTAVAALKDSSSIRISVSQLPRDVIQVSMSSMESANHVTPIVNNAQPSAPNAHPAPWQPTLHRLSPASQPALSRPSPTLVEYAPNAHLTAFNAFRITVAPPVTMGIFSTT